VLEPAGRDGIRNMIKGIAAAHGKKSPGEPGLRLHLPEETTAYPRIEPPAKSGGRPCQPS
jgi:hypothetical protein